MTRPSPPAAERRPETVELHGISRTDDYAWLRDPEWRDVLRDPTKLSPDIRAYLEAENAHTEAVLGPYEELKRRLVAEMRARMPEEDASVPSPDGPWAYFNRFREGGQHPQWCRIPRDGAPETDATLLLDGDKEAEGRDFFRIVAARHSPDHRLLAWATDTAGNELYTIRVRDLDSGTDLAIAIEGNNGGFAWANDSRTLFYLLVDENHRASSVWRRRVDRPDEEAVLVYREDDPGFFLGVARLAAGRFLAIDAHQRNTSEVYLVDADDPASPPRVVAERTEGIEYAVEQHGDRLIIRTNADDCEDYKLVTAPLAAPGRENWVDLVPHRPGCLIRGYDLFEQHLVRLETENALPRIVVRDLASDAEHAIAFDEAAYALNLGGGFEYATTALRFGYSSMTTPAQVFDYDMASRARTLRKTQKVPSGHDPAAYVTRRITATASDGTEIPVSILARADVALDGTAPLLLYGYGSYGISMPASFGTNRLSLVDRGVVYAIAHIRGGMEGGYRWYREGRREAKTNTFTDYIACAEALIDAGYTAVGRIVGHGGSAGGMLMGAVANLRPDLFAGIVAEVPFVDVLSTMCDASLPLTPPEFPEWGNPIEDPEVFRRIAAYSPYDNVAARAYPAMLVTAGITDPRVTYWEPAKWVARLRELKTDDSLLLLKTEMAAGHAGAAGRFDKLEEVALAYTFALLTVGLADKELDR
ncbi:MAG: S9 family peptidase [Alphaproteobacteria bacterium]